MNKPDSGILYVVATPIGNLDDITLRALQILKTVDYIVAEDTRHSRKLLAHFNIHQKYLSLHNYNEQQQSSKLLQILQQGLNLAMISDAGTPLISDPGYTTIKLLRTNGIKIIGIPGPCAAILALSVAGLPTNKFVFEGFLPITATARHKHLAKLKTETRTLIFYEAPHRLLTLIDELIDVFGGERHVVIARELTKKFETIQGDQLNKLKNWLNSNPEQQQGELVILVAGAENEVEPTVELEAKRILHILAEELPTKQAAKLTHKITGLKINQLYQEALCKSSS